MTKTNDHSAKRPPRVNGLLLSLLGLLLLVEVVTVVVVLASQQFAADRALTEHTEELLRNVTDETRENAAAFLNQAQDTVTIAAGVFEAGIFLNAEPDELERYFLQQLRVIPQLDAFYFGSADGDFVFSKKEVSDNERTFVTKVIQNDAADERVIFIRRDSDHRELSRTADPDDRFDPRTRPWYEAATKSTSEIWTAPYVFYTSRKPGLTVARAVRDENGRLLGVLGADIELSALSDFLRTQKIGSSGAAFIVYSNGDVIAHPANNTAITSTDDRQLHLQRLSDFDPVTALAGERLHQFYPSLVTLNHAFLDRFESDSQSYTSLFVPFLNSGKDRWVMGAFAPDNEMAESIRKGQRESIYLGVAMALLTITLALLLAILVFRPISTLQRQAREDPLTGLLNRRSFEEIAAKRLGSPIKAGSELSVMMIDIDNFKSINDRYGHTVGDEVLMIVARRVLRGLSDESALSRYGGEEFAVLLPHATILQGEKVAERIRQQVAATPVQTSGESIAVTISLGVAELSEADRSINELLDRADQRLLAAKKRGRNQVIASGP